MKFLLIILGRKFDKFQKRVLPICPRHERPASCIRCPHLKWAPFGLWDFYCELLRIIAELRGK